VTQRGLGLVRVLDREKKSAVPSAKLAAKLLWTLNTLAQLATQK
jgi:hypothetical protein